MRARIIARKTLTYIVTAMLAFVNTKHKFRLFTVNVRRNCIKNCSQGARCRPRETAPRRSELRRAGTKGVPPARTRRRAGSRPQPIGTPSACFDAASMRTPRCRWACKAHVSAMTRPLAASPLSTQGAHLNDALMPQVTPPIRNPHLRIARTVAMPACDGAPPIAMRTAVQHPQCRLQRPARRVIMAYAHHAARPARQRRPLAQGGKPYVGQAGHIDMDQRSVDGAIPGCNCGLRAAERSHMPQYRPRISALCRHGTVDSMSGGVHCTADAL